MNISVTGHRNLLELDQVEELLSQKLSFIQQHNSNKSQCEVLVGFAEHTDNIAREQSESLGIKLCELRNEEKNDYKLLADRIVKEADHLIVVWDGVYTGKIGGTSDIARRVLETDRKVIIHHLVVPRESNLFPVSPLLELQPYDNSGKRDSLPFAVSYSWVRYIHDGTPKKRHFFKPFSKSYHFTHLLPLIGVIATIGLGMYGFAVYDKDLNKNNLLFNAINLLNFNSSVIAGKSNVVLDVARWLGLSTTVFTVFGAIYLVIARQRKLWLVKAWSALGYEYILVLGHSEKSYYLIKDLLANNKRVVIIDNDSDATHRSDIESKGGIWIDGYMYSKELLEEVRWHNAKNVFILSDKDSDNARAIQEINYLFGQILLGNKDRPKSSQKYCVHVRDRKIKNLLYNNLSPKVRFATSFFSIEQNIARRMQSHYPFDRFYQGVNQSNVCHMVIFGFGEQGKRLALLGLHQGHFIREHETNDQEQTVLSRQLKIHVFCNDHENVQSKFESEYDVFSNGTSQCDAVNTVKSNVWQDDAITFYDLPISEALLLDSKHVIYNSILSENNIASMYVCLDDPIQSSALASSLLPKLDYVKNKKNNNLQLHVQYNVSDVQEYRNMQIHLNSLAPNMPVTCFGNYNIECKVTTIEDTNLDQLPKELAYHYNKDENNRDRSWLNESEKNKDSNRQAADHIWVKMREVWSHLEWKDNYASITKIANAQVKDLSPTEHRRWSADLLINGSRPLIQSDMTEQQKQELNVEWHGGKKNMYKSHQLHIDLVPFGALTEGEQLKDESQVKAIPKFLKKIIK